MHAPSATHRQTSPAAGQSPPVTPARLQRDARAAASSRTAATSTRAAPPTSGIAEGLTAGRLCVDMSTVDPAASRRVAQSLAAKGVRFIDAPVSGGVPRAEEGTLAIMVGGEARDVEEARPALIAMGANVIHVGAVGSGEVAKLCNNLIAGVSAVAVAEAFRIAEGFGVDAGILTDVISKSSGNTWVMQFMHPVPGIVAKSASSNDYTPGFMTDLMAKDLGLAVNAARELRVPVVGAA